LCEGFGLPILEAMRAGCPVITCRNSSIPEVAGDAALYVSERDPKQLAEGLQNVQNPSVRLAMIKQGLEQAKRFACDRSAVLLERAIREVASQPPGQQPPVGKSVLRDPTVPPEWEAAQVSRPVAA
jgi:glycosyltransferase involved in cell wall biosynthesis